MDIAYFQMLPSRENQCILKDKKLWRILADDCLVEAELSIVAVVEDIWATMEI